MKTDAEQIKDTFLAAKSLNERGEWKLGDPYMEDDLGNIRFLGWCHKFENELKSICDKCPFQVSHPTLWLDETHTRGIPANKLCAAHTKDIGTCYDTVNVAKHCQLIDREKFKVYVREIEAYHKWWDDKLKK
jgi:hypothetical protein